MKKCSVILVSTITLMLISILSYSQEYLISQGGSITTCSGTLYDSGGAEGNYGSSEDYSITIQSSSPGHSVSLYFEEFALESSTFDYVNIYDGDSDQSPSIVMNHGSSSLLENTITSTGEMLTIVMRTDGSANYPGFKAIISCAFDCQDFSISISDLNPYYTYPDSMMFDVCLGDTINFVAIGDYPNSGVDYEQSDELVYWQWNIYNSNENEIIENYGDNSLSYVFNNPGGHVIMLSARDINGCVEVLDYNMRVRASLIPDFSNISIESGICLGEELLLEGNAYVEPWTQEVTETVFVQTCFEDVVGVEQGFCFDIPTSDEVTVITSADQIESLCMNMEHSYMGDLDIRLECPNGQSIYLFQQACGSTYFGEPNHSDDCEPGTGYDYCWTSDASSLMSDQCNSGNSLPPGNYLPFNSFEGLIGCPVVGDWCLYTVDNLGLDDGNIFSITLSFEEGVYDPSESAWTYTTNLNLEENAGWTGVGVVSETEINTTATPLNTNIYSYVFYVEDDFGCTHFNTYEVEVYDIDNPFCGMFCNDYVYTSMSDIINDGSGDDYPSQNNSQCTWLITPESKSESCIFFQWTYFNLQENDTLFVYDGLDSNSDLIGAFTHGSDISQSFVTSSNTAYLVYVTDDYGRSEGWELMYETVLVNREMLKMEDVSVFPNPANEKLYISGLTENSKISIIDLSGKAIIFESQLSNSFVDISKLSPGVYFIKIDSDGMIETRKFVKQ